jgi:MFS family permease
MSEATSVRGRTVGVLTIATCIHALSASTVFIIPAIAPKIAEARGIATALIGLQVSLVYIGAMVMSVFSGSIAARFGSARASQLSLLVSVAGLGLATLPSLPSLAVASLILGMGYGMINPPTGVMLERVATPSTRGLLFSIKQSAVPLGGIFAGLLGPTCALLLGWEGALLVVAATALVTIGLLQLDGTADGRPALRTFGSRPPLLRDLELVWSIAPLRWTTLAAFLFAGVQFTMTTYLVALLVENVGLGLVAAGIGLSIFQAAAVAGRLFWGVVADVTKSGLVVIAVAFAASLLSILPIPFMAADWPLATVYFCMGVLGVMCAGWNGVYVSEIVRLSPPGTAARTIGGSFVFSFGGAVTIPALFALVHRTLHSYSAAVWLIALVAVAGCFCVLRALSAARMHRSAVLPTTVDSNA